METLLCLDSKATFLGIFDPSIAPLLLYYAYLPIIGISLLLGGLVFVNKNKFHLPNKIFFVFVVIYSLYLINEIIQWIAVPVGLVHFSWELIALFFAMIPLILFYFTYTYVEQKDLPFAFKVLLIVLLTPVLLLLPSTLNTEYFDIVLCQAQVGKLSIYLYFLITLTIVALSYFGIKKSFDSKSKQPLFLAAGSTLMLAILMFADIISENLGNFEFNLIGPLGMLIFVIIITYMIVRYRAFEMKVAGAQALVFGLVILIASQLLFVRSETSQILITLTLIISIFGGYFLIKSVKREIKQREENERLAENLAKVNDRLRILDKQKSEFVSIASHQLRSPLTAIRGYVSLIEEGSFGPVPEKMTDALHRISESGKFMAVSIDDFLNVSRIESGNMKYEYKDINLREQTEHIVEDLRADATKRGLMLLFKTDLHGKGIVNADFGKTQQILHNLINNALKYTRKGSVTVFVHDDPVKKQINVEFIDTGIGMSPETLEKLFGKFARAKIASSANIMGTGLGLFVARAMARAMKGDVTAHSDGEGKGSRFVLTLPYVM